MKLEGELEEQVRRDFRWNFLVASLDFGIFMAAMSFVSTLTVLPAFVSHFTSSNLLIGLIPSIATLGWFLPQLVSANYVERMEVKKRFIVTFTAGERFPWLFMALTTLLLWENPLLALVFFFALYGVSNSTAGFLGPAWMDMLAKVIPQGRRGMFFGFGNFLGSLLGVVCALLVGYIMKIHVFPSNFALCFFSAFLLTLVSWVFLGLVKEPRSPVVKKSSTFLEYLSGLPRVLGADRDFSFYLLSSVILSFGGMATSFYTVYAIKSLNLTGEDIGLFTALTLASQTVAYLLWGYVGDKRGHKLVMEASALSGVIGALLAFYASSINHFYAVFLVTGVSMSAGMISGMNIALEFSPPEKRPTYVGLASTIRAPFVSLSPIMGGILADSFHYTFVFLLTSVMLTAGLTLLLFVKNPRQRLAATT